MGLKHTSLSGMKRWWYVTSKWSLLNYWADDLYAVRLSGLSQETKREEGPTNESDGPTRTRPEYDCPQYDEALNIMWARSELRGHVTCENTHDIKAPEWKLVFHSLITHNIKTTDSCSEHCSSHYSAMSYWDIAPPQQPNACCTPQKQLRNSLRNVTIN